MKVSPPTPDLQFWKGFLIHFPFCPPPLNYKQNVQNSIQYFPLVSDICESKLCVSVFRFWCYFTTSLFSAEVELGLSCICICICLLSAIKSIYFWSRTGAAMYVCVYCVVRGRLNLSRLEIIWKCSPSPLGTFHYLSRLSRFHTSTSNTVLIITKTKREIALLLISWNWEVFGGCFLILLCQPTAGFHCWVIADETWCPRNYVFIYQTSLLEQITSKFLWKDLSFQPSGMCGTGCPRKKYPVEIQMSSSGLFARKRQYSVILS